MHGQSHFRMHAIWAGVFFIIATSFLFIGEALYKPVLTAPDALTLAAAQKSRVTLGILTELVCALAMPLIAIVLYPVLRLISPVFAIGYVAIRLFEAMILFNAEINLMQIVSLSQAYVAAGATDGAALAILVGALARSNEWAGSAGVLYNVVFMIGALMLYTMLWRARLVPRWISGWGLVSVIALGTVAVTATFVDVPPAVGVSLIVPLAVQEMVMAVWFIFRGFAPLPGRAPDAPA